MKLIVFSDSHGSVSEMRKIIQRNKDADIFIHLGDGADSFISLTEEMKVFGRAVKGNCDIFSFSDRRLEGSELFTLEGKRIFITHGHIYGVSYSLERLIFAARERDADILLYGHTHVKQNLYLEENEVYKKPLYVMNPGSISKPRDGSASFGYIEIKEGANVMINTAELL